MLFAEADVQPQLTAVLERVVGDGSVAGPGWPPKPPEWRSLYAPAQSTGYSLWGELHWKCITTIMILGQARRINCSVQSGPFRDA